MGTAALLAKSKLEQHLSGCRAVCRQELHCPFGIERLPPTPYPPPLPPPVPSPLWAGDLRAKGLPLLPTPTPPGPPPPPLPGVPVARACHVWPGANLVEFPDCRDHLLIVGLAHHISARTVKMRESGLYKSGPVPRTSRRL